MDMNNGPEAWYRNLPIITKTILTSTFAITLCITLQILSAPYVFLSWRDVYTRFQLWRLITNYLYVGGFSISWIIHMYLFTQFSTKLEKNEIFADSPGSFLAFIFYQMIGINLLSLVIFWPDGIPLLGSSLLFAIIYYWSRRESWSYIGIWGFTVQGYQLPFVLMLLNLLMGSSLWFDLLGLINAHLYFFLRDVLPNEGGPDLLGRTPRIFDKIISFFPKDGNRTSTSTNRIYQIDSNRNNNFSGTGYTLGRGN